MATPALDPAAIVRPADDLESLARRVGEREKKNRKGQLEHVKRQAADVWAARQQCKRGEWGPWCQRAGLSQQQAWKYAEYGKTLLKGDFSELPEDEQWLKWQRISGNAGPIDEEYDLPPLIEKAPHPELTLHTEDEDDGDQSEDLDDQGRESEDHEEDEEEEPDNSRAAFLIRVDTAIKCAQFTGDKATKKMIGYARRVAETWVALAERMEGLR